MSKQDIRRGEGGGGFDRRRARGVLDPCPRRESKAQTAGLLRGKLISEHDMFSSFEGQQGAGNGQESRGVFKGYKGIWAAGCWLGSQFHQLKASTVMDIATTSFHVIFA